MKLTLFEIVNLFHELNGLSRTENGKTVVVVNGLFKQKLSLKVRVYIQRLSKAITEDYKMYNEFRNELHEKYAEEVDGNKIIPHKNVEAFNAELKEFLDAERDIEVTTLWSTDLKIDDLSSIETEEHYPVFLKLIDN